MSQSCHCSFLEGLIHAHAHYYYALLFLYFALLLLKSISKHISRTFTVGLPLVNLANFSTATLHMATLPLKCKLAILHYWIPANPDSYLQFEKSVNYGIFFLPKKNLLAIQAKSSFSSLLPIHIINQQNVYQHKYCQLLIQSVAC